MSANQNALSEQWANFIDLTNDVKPFIGIPSTDTTRDSVLQLVIDGMCDWVQRELKRPIAPSRFSRRFDGYTGWTGAYLQLPYYPVLEVVSVTEYWGHSGAHVLSEQTPTNQVDGFTCDYKTGLLTRVFPGLVPKPWFPGARNIEITWEAGYNPVPASLRLGCMEAVKEWWVNTQQASRAPIVRPGDYDGNVVQSEFFASVMASRLVPLLAPFQQIGIG